MTNSRRDFVFVKDLAQVVLKAVYGKGKGTYHFSCGKDVSILELYNELLNKLDLITNLEPEIQEISDKEVKSILTDPDKTLKILEKLTSQN